MKNKPVIQIITLLFIGILLLGDFASALEGAEVSGDDGELNEASENNALEQEQTSSDEIDEIIAGDSEEIKPFDLRSLTDNLETSSEQDYSFKTASIASESSAIPAPQVVSKSSEYLRLGENQYKTDLFTGSATYVYPIGVPPGRNALQPDIKLFYNHQTTSGLPTQVGTAWTLTENYIERDINNTVADTSDDSFRILLNGASAKLVFAEGSFHTERESFTRVEKINGGSNEKGEFWVAKTKDGISYRFGYISESEQVSNKASYVLRWYLDKIEDMHNNIIEYEYSENPNAESGTTYLTAIKYNEDTNVIDFKYNYGLASRRLSYDSGQKVESSGLLTEISVKNNGDLVTKYSLGYTKIGQKWLLANVTEYGSDGVSALPATTFSYSSPVKGWTSSGSLPSGVNLTDVDEGYRMIDVNGDGLTDIIRMNNSNDLDYWINTENGWSNRTTITNFLTGGFVDKDGNDLGVRFADVNGDAKVDIVQSLTGDVTRKVIKINRLNDWTDGTMALPNAFFMSLKYNPQQCTPDACPSGFNDAGVSCSKGICSRACQILNCTGNGAVVMTDTVEPNWADDAYNKQGTSSRYTPSSNKCYKFEYTGSPKTDDSSNSGDSECYDLSTNEITAPSGGWSSYDIDCNGDSIDAYAGVGFITPSYYSSSWLSSVPGGGDYGFIGNVENGYWDYRYLSLYGHDGSPDNYGPNEEDWDGFNSVLCDEAGTQAVYCASSAAACGLWGKDRCGYGCSGQITGAFAVSGIYTRVNGDLSDALNDYEPDHSCGSVVDDNDYFGYGTYKVMEYDAALATYYQQCAYTQYFIYDNGTRIADVNGDGLSDIIQANPWLTKTWINKGNAFVEDSSWRVPSAAAFVDSNYRDTGVRLEDVNGDGLLDIVQANYNNFKIWLNTRSGWELDASRNIPVAFLDSSGQSQGVQLIDVNADGLVDVVQATSSVKKVWINNGLIWELDASYSLPDVDFKQQSFQLSDMNGDGVVDIVKSRSVYTNNAVKPYLLSSIKNYIGGTTYIDYSKITSFDNDGSDGISDLASTGWVVKNITLDNGLSNEHAVSETYIYDYSNGLYDSSTREFRGFADVNETISGNTRTTHKFYQDYQKKGLEYENEIVNESGKYRKVENTWTIDDKGGYYRIELSAVQETRYDRDNEIVKIGNVYDNYGNVIKINDFGDVSINGDEEYTDLSYAYNTVDWVLNKLATKIIYYQNNNIFRSEAYYYDNLNLGAVSVGDLTKRVDLISNSLSAVSLFEYYPEGNLKRAVDPNSHETNYEYDSTKTFAQTVTNALGQSTHYIYDLGTGNLLSVEDSNGYETKKTYDVFGRELKEIREYDSESSPTLSITYSFDGSAPEGVKIQAKERSGITSDSYEYIDGFGREIQVKQSSENGVIARDILYNNDGRVRAESNPYYSSQGYTAPATAPRTFYTYDALGRVISTTNADSKTQRAIYGKTVSLYDELNRRKDFVYDSKYRIVQVKEYNDGTYLTNYTYDQNDQILSILDSKNNKIMYSYDGLGKQISLTDSDLGHWSFSYDAAGNLVERTDARGRKVSLSYDTLNRIISDGSATYVYDAQVDGTVSEVRTPYMTTIYSYDHRLRPVSEVKIIDGMNFTTEYQYDSKDRVISVKLPDNSIQNYSYSQIGGIKSVSGIVDIDYNFAGLPVRKTFGNGLVSTYSYDNNLFRLKALSTGNVQSKSYEYDSIGNVLKITDGKNSKVTDYSYDLLDRLTGAISLKGTSVLLNQSFVYDPIGNLLNMTSFDGRIGFAYGSRAHGASKVYDQIHYHPPVISCAQHISVMENEVLHLSVNVSDVDGDAVTLTYGSPLNQTGDWQTTYTDSGNYTVRVFAYDGDFNVSKDVSVTVINVNRAPVITSSYKSVYYIGEESKLSLNLTAYDLDAGTTLQKRWFVNGANAGEGSYFVFSPNGSAGIYRIDAQASDGQAITNKSFSVQVSKVPVTLGLDGNTSIVRENETSSFYPFILEKSGKGKIIFKEPVNLSELVDFVNTVIFQDKYVSLDSDILGALRNVPAHVVLYNVVTDKNPIIYYSGGFGASEMEKPCPSSICSNIIYSGNTLEFDVAHFSTFSLEESVTKQIDLGNPTNLDFEILPGMDSFDQTFTINNNGLSELDMTIFGEFNSGFDLSVSPGSVVLPGQSSASLKLSGNIVPLTKWDTYDAGKINFKDANFEQISKVYFKLKEPISINNFDIKVGSKTYSDVEDGDTVDFAPGDDMTVSLDIENLYTEDEGIKIEDAQVELNIDKIDDGESLTQDSSKVNINAGETKGREIKFTLPDEISEKDYTLEITFSAEINGVNYKEMQEVDMKSKTNSAPKEKAKVVNESVQMSSANNSNLHLSGKLAVLSENLPIVFLLTANALLFVVVILFLFWLKKRRDARGIGDF